MDSEYLWSVLDSRWTIVILIITTVIIILIYVWRRLPFTYHQGRFQWGAASAIDIHTVDPHQLTRLPILLDLTGLSFQLSAKRLHISVERMDVWVCHGDESGTSVLVRPDSSLWRRRVMRAIKNVVVFVGKRVVVKVHGGIRARMCSVGKENHGACERLFFVQADIESVLIAWTFDQQCPLSIEKITLKEVCQFPTHRVEERTIVSIDRVNLLMSDEESVLSLGERISVDISSSFMMLVGSFIDRQIKKQTVVDTSAARNIRLQIPFPDTVARLKTIKLVTFTIHVPVFDPELHCLDRVQFSAKQISGHLFIEDMMPYFSLDIGRAALSARYLELEDRSGFTCSRADAIWGQSLEGEAELLVIENLCLSDYGKTDFGLSTERISEYIRDISGGRGPWWWRGRTGFNEQEYSSTLTALSNSLAFGVDRNEIGASPSQFIVLGTMDSLRLYVPSEFPFGFMFDQIVYVYKSAMKGESWDVVSTATGDFVIRVSVKDVSVVFGDDEIDVAIGRVLMCKQQLLKLGLGDNSAENLAEYMRICELYSESHVDSNQLMKVHGTEIVFQAQWKQEWSGNGSEGIVQILSGMSEEQELSVPLLASMDTLIGGHIDLSACDLTISFRDYALPMLSAPKVRMHGLLFVLELLPGDEAVQKIPLSVYAKGLTSNLSRAPNGDSFVLKNTNPLKIFHCVNFITHGTKLTHIAFSPRWIPAFQQMDRAAENFASPMADPSPILPIWDKVRFLLRGTYTALTVRTPCHFDLLLGDNLQAVDERLTIILPEGSKIEQGPDGRLAWDIRSGMVVASSTKLALLKHHLCSEGARFARSDKRECLYLGEGTVFLATIPKCRLKAQFRFRNQQGVECVDHFAVKTVVKEHASAGHDTFHEFRSDHILMKLSVEESSIVDLDNLFGRLAVSYYRELEEWIVDSMSRIIDVPCKKGSLWRTVFVPQHRPIDIKRYLKDISFKVQLQNQPLEVRLLSFHSVDQFSGVSISASGFNINYYWRRHNLRYRTLLGDWNISDGKIACFSANAQNIKSANAVSIVEGIVGMEVLRAPIISSTSTNETLLHLPEDMEILTERIKSLRQSQAELAEVKETLDEISLKHKEEFIAFHIDSLEEAIKNVTSNQRLIGRSIYRAYDPNLSWDEDSREAVYNIFYQQTVREEYKFARTRNMEKLLEQVSAFYKGSGQQTKPAAKASNASLVQEKAAVDRIFQEILCTVLDSGKSRIAEPDYSNLSGKKNMDLRSPLELQSAYDVPYHTRIQLINPQIALSVPIVSPDESKKGRAVLLVVPEATVESCRIYKKDDYREESSHNQALGRRLKFSIGNAQLFVVPSEHQGAVFFSHHTKIAPKYGRITDKISISCCYDYCYSSASVAPDSLFSASKGDSIRIYCPSFALRTTSEEFQTILACITRLLVHRDQMVSTRSERKAQMYRKAVAGRPEVLQSLGELMRKLKEQCAQIEADLIASISTGDFEAVAVDLIRMLDDRQLELSVLAEALNAMKSEQEKITTKQTPLLIDANLEEAAWTLLEDDAQNRMAGIVLTGIRDEWQNDAEGGVGTTFEIHSIIADGGRGVKIVEQLTHKLAEQLNVEIPGLSALPSSAIRFSFQAAQAKSVGKQRSIEHAELNLAPLRLVIKQAQAARLFHYFFPKDAPNSKMQATSSSTSRVKEKYDFTIITVPASSHLLTFTPESKSDFSRSLMEITDFLLQLPDLDYSNQQCTWDDLAIKLRNDAILILLKNAGALLKQKFASQSGPKEVARDARTQKDAIKDFYHEEALPDTAGETDASRRDRVQAVAREEQEKKGKFLFGKYF